MTGLSLRLRLRTRLEEKVDNWVAISESPPHHIPGFPNPKTLPLSNIYHQRIGPLTTTKSCTGIIPLRNWVAISESPPYHIPGFPNPKTLPLSNIYHQRIGPLTTIKSCTGVIPLRNWVAISESPPHHIPRISESENPTTQQHLSPKNRSAHHHKKLHWSNTTSPAP